jgi:hypothetical protein
MGVQSAPAAGNTVQSLTSTPVEAVQTTVIAPSTLVEATETPETSETPKTLAQVNEGFAAITAAAIPKPSATQPPTGTTPVEWKEPALGPKSASGPAPVPYAGEHVATNYAASPAFKSLYVTREEFEALEERLAAFNARSSQKI